MKHNIIKKEDYYAIRKSKDGKDISHFINNINEFDYFFIKGTRNIRIINKDEWNKYPLILIVKKEKYEFVNELINHLNKYKQFVRFLNIIPNKLPFNGLKIIDKDEL